MSLFPHRFELGLVEDQEADKDKEAAQDPGCIDALHGLILGVERLLLAGQVGRDQLGIRQK